MPTSPPDLRSASSASRRGSTLACAVTGALGAATLVYRGPGHGFLRGTVADALVVIFLYALLGRAWRAPAAVRAALVGGLALAVELRQLVVAGGAPRGLAGELTVGATFDPWDLVAYAVGLAVAVTVERAVRRRRRATSAAIAPARPPAVVMRRVR